MAFRDYLAKNNLQVNEGGNGSAKNSYEDKKEMKEEAVVKEVKKKDFKKRVTLNKKGKK
jgi:hypothetical protein